VATDFGRERWRLAGLSLAHRPVPARRHRSQAKNPGYDLVAIQAHADELLGRVSGLSSKASSSVSVFSMPLHSQFQDQFSSTRKKER